MAEDFIEEIYARALVIFRVKRAIEYCREGKRHIFYLDWKELGEKLAAFCKGAAAEDPALAGGVWTAFVGVRDRIEQGRFSEAADEMEEILPALYKAMEGLCTIDVEEGDYRIFSSRSGFLSLQDTKTRAMLCSRTDPAWEAYGQAKGMYQPKMKRFATLGCGLGYLCWQMYEVTNQSIDIYVYDTDENLIRYAMQFGVLGWIPKERLHLVTEKNPNRLLERFLEELDLFRDRTAVLNFEKDTFARLTAQGQAIMQRVSFMIQTARDFQKIQEQNYYRNCMAVKKTFQSLLPSEKRREWIVVAAGPSVDYRMDYLKEAAGKKGLIVVTRIYRKLVEAGIQPDYMAALDPQNMNYEHLEEIPNADTPLIFTDSANWQYGEKYPGEKYLVHVDGQYYAQSGDGRNEGEKWYSQGTVAAFCIEIAARFGASSIELVGLDLAYPGKKTHASGTLDNPDVDHANMIKVKSVGGGEVYTTLSFAGYIQDIEEQIREHPQIKFYNLSRDGAYIRGCGDEKALFGK